MKQAHAMVTLRMTDVAVATRGADRGSEEWQRIAAAMITAGERTAGSGHCGDLECAICNPPRPVPGSLSWCQVALAMLMTGTDGIIIDALAMLPSRQRVLLARLICASMEAAILSHAMADQPACDGSTVP